MHLNISNQTLFVDVTTLVGSFASRGVGEIEALTLTPPPLMALSATDHSLQITLQYKLHFIINYITLQITLYSKLHYITNGNGNTVTLTPPLPLL